MRVLLLSFILFLSSVLFAQLELPKFSADDTIIRHYSYSLSFNQKYHQANWVAYLLTPSLINQSNRVKRSNNFKADPLIPGTDLTVDYYKSGYDRGHFVPAADMAFSETAMKESFYYSNMSPQVASFNRGVWKKLETQVRNWTIEYDSLFVVTGPIFSDSMQVIGPHRVAVPKAYYKVLLKLKDGKFQGIGFVLKNESSKLPLQSFVLTIDEVETITGIDFFPLLEDSLEENIESEVCFDCWML